MKFTAQEEYGLRCILSLAREEECPDADPEAPRPRLALSVAEIAEREGLTARYAGKLVRVLGRSGLVRSVRGRNGGYRLARRADEISVAETLRALGGTFYKPETCRRYTGGRKQCVHASDCSIRSLWTEIQRLLDRVLARTSLRDLIREEGTVGQWLQTRVDEVFPVLVRPPSPPGPQSTRRRERKSSS